MGAAVAATLLAAGLGIPLVAPTPARADTAADASATNPATAAAAATAQAKRTGKPVDIPALTTPTETVAADPSGSLTLTQSLYPTRVKQDGSWKAVDPALHTTSDGRITPAAVPSAITLSGGGSGPLASLTSYGKQLAISWPGTLPKPTLAGSTATYAEVLPGVDLQATVSPLGGFSEVLVVKNSAAAANPKLATLTLGTTAVGLSVSGDKAGNLKATDPTGAAFFTSPTAMMWDSSSLAPASTSPTASPSSATSKASRASVTDTPSSSPTATAVPGSNDPASDDGPGPGAQTAQIPAAVSAGKLTLTPDSTVLRGPGTHYPVYIDPAWNPNYATDPKQAYDEIQQGCPDKNALNSSTAPYDTPGVGLNAYSGCTGLEEAFFQFKLDSRLTNASARIINATFKVKEVYAASLDCDRTSNVQVRLTGAIGSSTSWSNRPELKTVQDTKPFGSTCTTNPSQGFNVTNAFIQAATAKPAAWPSVPLGMFATDESEKLNFRRFANNPTVDVSYDTVPAVSSPSTSPTTPCAGGTTIGHTTVSLNGNLTDADQGAAIQGKFTLIGKDGTGKIVYPAGGTGPASAEPSNTVTGSGTVTWNTGYLPTGTYTWTVQADDGKYLSPTSTCHFAVDASAPGAPTITSTDIDDHPGSWPARTEANFVVHAPVDAATNKPATDVVRYVYGWGTPPPTVDPPHFRDAAAAGADTPLPLTPVGFLYDVLYVYAVDAAGNESPANTYAFTTARPTLADPTGDFTGDSKPDLVTPGPDGDVRLYTGNGNGTLSTPLKISTGGGFSGAKLAIGGFRSWGEQDVLAITADGQAHIYYGNGDAEPLPSFARRDSDTPGIAPKDALLSPDTTFDWSQVTAVTADDSGYAVGDYPNLWVTTGDGALWWVPGTFAAGSFDTPIQLAATGWQGKTLVYGGVKNGHPALWARDNTGGELSLYTGTEGAPAGSDPAAKSVIAASGWTAAAHPQISSAGDSNADGKPDLWATDNQPVKDLYYYAGSTAGPLATPLRVQTLNPQGDITGDGQADILAVDTAGNQYIYAGTSDTKTASFTNRFLTGTSWDGVNSINVGDINGDSRPDLLARMASDSTLWVYPNTGGTGTNTFGTRYEVGVGWGGKNIIMVGDVNGDGKVDILARTTSDSSLWVYPNAGGTGTSTFGSPYKVGDSWGGQSVIRLGDINGDGKTDILSVDTAGNQYVYPNTGGTGTSTFGTRYLIGTGWSGTSAISLSDIDSDGKLDILARSAADNGLYAYPNTGNTGTSTFGSRYHVGDSWGGQTVII
ncbi:FG-GAP repeat domain-containing protein [Streptomyces sp. H39-C1]|uniref:FG-GAP repeat domain-containing protein n=1 Tax=Streptomyces sp. H39-C1 TaxID=3004355 RepID=UPI0022AEE285|nr:VCBS repeat-containing protein [Streptomyces sp. H39-C1]MCZ4099802.1 VCBS repeat-containing protein [Streptomyces sp. H39-C1]